MTRRFLFSTKMESSNQKVLEALMLAGRVTCTSTIVVITEYNTVAALLDTLDTAEELDMDGRRPPDSATVPAADHVVVTKPKREPKAKEKVECPKCHNQVSTMYMLKDGSMCKMCSMKAKRLAKSQPAEKLQPAQSTAYHPETWTNQRPEFGKEEAVSQIRDKPYVQVDLHKLAGRRVG